MSRKLYTPGERDALRRALETPAKTYVVGTEWKGFPVLPRREDGHARVVCPRCDTVFKVDLEDLREGCE